MRGICPCTFRGRQIRETLIFSLERIFDKCNVFFFIFYFFLSDPYWQGAKKIIFTACHSGKLKQAFTSPDVISTSPKSFSSSRIDFTLLLLFEFLKEHHLPVGQVKNRFHSVSYTHLTLPTKRIV